MAKLDESREVLFKLRYPDGNWVVIHADGYVEGIPPGTVIVNRYPVIIAELLARRECAEQDA